MFANLNGWHAIILLVVILLLFGAPRIPALARSLGQSLRIFKTEVKPGDDATTADESTAADATVADATVASTTAKSDRA